MEIRINKLLFLFFCMFISPLIVNAECNYQRNAELKKIASNVLFSYSYEIKSVQQQTSNGIVTVNEPVFKVDISNITDDIYVIDNIDNVFTSNTTYTYDSINRVQFSIYSRDVNCPDKYLNIKYVTFPRFNYYSSSDECKQYPKFKYCSLWQNSDIIDEEEFNSELALYKLRLNNKAEAEDNGFNIAINWYFMIIIPVVVILLIIIFAFVRRRRI